MPDKMKQKVLWLDQLCRRYRGLNLPISFKFSPNQECVQSQTSEHANMPSVIITSSVFLQLNIKHSLKLNCSINHHMASQANLHPTSSPRKQTYIYFKALSYKLSTTACTETPLKIVQVNRFPLHHFQKQFTIARSTLEFLCVCIPWLIVSHSIILHF